MLRIDNHVLPLVRYPVQSDLLPLVICCQHVIEGHDCHIFADVLRWHGVLIAGVGDEAVFLYPPQVDLIDDVLPRKGVQPLFLQPLKGNLVGGGVYVPVDFIASGQRLSIQICQAVVLDPHHEIIPHKLHRPLYLPLRLAPVRPAQDGFEPIESRKVLKLPGSAWNPPASIAA